MDSNPRRQVANEYAPVEIPNPAGRPAGLLTPPYETKTEKGENMTKKGKAKAAPKTGAAGDRTARKAAIICDIRNRVTGDSNALTVYQLDETGQYQTVFAKGDTRSNAQVPDAPTGRTLTDGRRWVNGITPTPGQRKVYAIHCVSHGSEVYAVDRFIGNTARRYTNGSHTLIQALKTGKDGNPVSPSRGRFSHDADGNRLTVRTGKNAGKPGQGFIALPWCPGCATRAADAETHTDNI
jgi:hypothetical protein